MVLVLCCLCCKGAKIYHRFGLTHLQTDLLDTMEENLHKTELLRNLLQLVDVSTVLETFPKSLSPSNTNVGISIKDKINS